jgi:hypothetical protein
MAAAWQMSVPGVSVTDVLEPTSPVPETDRRWVGIDLSGARFHNVDLSRAKLTGVWAQEIIVDGAIERMTVNGIDVMPYVEQQLFERHPELGKVWSGDLGDLREAWRTAKETWATTEAEVATLDPALLERSVDGEYSYLQTLRHLVFASDAWLRRCLLGEDDYWPGGVVFDEIDPEVRAVLPLDRDAAPSLDEVMAVRLDRRAVLDRLLDEMTPERLAEHPPARDRNGYPPDTSARTVLECLQCVVNEEWWHHSFAVRDLAVLTGRPWPVSVDAPA